MSSAMNCTVCEKEVFTNKEVKEFCALCSMKVENKQLVKEFDDSTKYFCCKTCMNKFMAFTQKHEGGQNV